MRVFNPQAPLTIQLLGEKINILFGKEILDCLLDDASNFDTILKNKLSWEPSQENDLTPKGVWLKLLADYCTQICKAAAVTGTMAQLSQEEQQSIQKAENLLQTLNENDAIASFSKLKISSRNVPTGFTGVLYTLLVLGVLGMMASAGALIMGSAEKDSKKTVGGEIGLFIFGVSTLFLWGGGCWAVRRYNQSIEKFTNLVNTLDSQWKAEHQFRIAFV